MELPPTQWLELTAYERDIIKFLNTTSPKSGSEIHDALGGVEGRETRKVVYDRLARLRDAGLIERHERDARADEYTTTTQALVLLSKLDECYE